MSDQPAAQPVPDPTGQPSAYPGVSVVMPVLDEERHLRQAVTRVLEQDYPGPVEVVVALGPSRDRTDEVAGALAAEDPRVRLVANPTGATGAGLNSAVAEGIARS